jgi:hypothetical protein
VENATALLTKTANKIARKNADEKVILFREALDMMWNTIVNAEIMRRERIDFVNRMLLLTKLNQQADKATSETSFQSADAGRLNLKYVYLGASEIETYQFIIFPAMQETKTFTVRHTVFSAKYAQHTK